MCAERNWSQSRTADDVALYPRDPEWWSKAILPRARYRNTIITIDVTRILRHTYTAA
jgi:hypothetical protein